MAHSLWIHNDGAIGNNLCVDEAVESPAKTPNERKSNELIEKGKIYLYEELMKWVVLNIKGYYFQYRPR